MIKEGSLLPLYGPSEYPSRQKYQRPSSPFLMTLRITMLPSHYEGFSMFYHPIFQTRFHSWTVFFFIQFKILYTFFVSPNLSAYDTLQLDLSEFASWSHPE